MRDTTVSIHCSMGKAPPRISKLCSGRSLGVRGRSPCQGQRTLFGAKLGQVWFGQVRLGQVWLGWVRLGLVRLGLVRLGLVQLGQVRLSQVRFSQVWFGKVWLGQIRFGWVRFGQVRLFQDNSNQVKRQLYMLVVIVNCMTQW